MNMTDKSVRL